MSVKLLTEHHFIFLSLTGGCTGSSESTLVKIQNCWKSYVTAQLWLYDTLGGTHLQLEVNPSSEQTQPNTEILLI